MRADTKSGNSPRRRSIAVEWQDCEWQPRIEVRRAPPLDFRSPRRNFNFQKPMKTILPHSRRNRAGFTLIELLVVIAIIGILAGLLLPTLAAIHKHGLMTKAKLEVNDIATAIQSYDSAYSRFPVSAAVQNRAAQDAQNGIDPDFTYGGFYNLPVPPGGTWPPGPLVNYPPNYSQSMSKDTSEVIAILMDVTNYPGTSTPTINTNYQKNPQQTIFLNAHMSGDTTSPGVGTDLVYRDPWGNPYAISMDLNYNEMCEDALYRTNAVSIGGLNGLVQDSAASVPDNWAFRGKIMVWSAGPDGQIDPASAANQGANKDNILSWK